MIEPNVWYGIFPKVLNMSITASVVIGLVLIARLFLKKAPKIFSYALWAVVLFRLVCPVSFETSLSLLNFTKTVAVEKGSVVYVPENIVHMPEPEVSVPIPVVGDNITQSINKMLPQGTEQTTADPLEAPVSIVTYVWLFGIAGMLVYSVISLLRLRDRLVGAVCLKENIWIADHIYTSFVMGLFVPRIYLQAGLSEREQEFVIMHEKIHIRRGDHLVKMFFWLVLAMHWFNPLVWLAYSLCMKDMEMSCDESVMKNMEEDVRTDYSELLLSLATGRKMFTGSALFFDVGDTKARIKNILNYKKPTVWVMVAGIVILAVLVVCFAGNPANSQEEQSESVTEKATEAAIEITTEQATTAKAQNYPEYPVYVRTMGVGSVGCEYGYCKLGEKSGEEILAELGEFSYFFNSPDHSEGVALYYDLADEEPQDVKLYHSVAGSLEYEEYAFAGPDYEFPWGAEPQKYVICVPEEYGMHYFFAVITWADGEQDLMYFPMEYAVRESNNMGVYKDLYNWLVMDYCWPDGERLTMVADGDVLNGFGPEGNSYAIYDVDKDRRKEMLVNYSTTYSAGMVTRIYDYDEQTGDYVKQFENYVSNTYYDNGIIKVDWSHNHSQGEAIWPYDLYRYNPEIDKYEMIASACSEDKAWMQDNFNDVLDIDGDGVLYIVTDATIGEQPKVLTKAEYEKWLAGYIGDAKEMNVPWKTLKFY